MGVRIFYMEEVDRRGIIDVMQEAHHHVTRLAILHLSQKMYIPKFTMTNKNRSRWSTTRSLSYQRFHRHPFNDRQMIFAKMKGVIVQ